ncbi:MAG TPA: hypothetical protein VF479_07680 [Pseudolysinimonas sp.]
MEIEEWWPNLDEVVRRRLINHPWEPVAPYVMEQVRDAGGPAQDSGWWEQHKGWVGGELFMPREAHLWILGQPDTKRLRESSERDPRADYLGRGWPRRQ